MAGHCSDISNLEFGYDVKKEVEHDAKKVENLMVEKDFLSPIYTLRDLCWDVPEAEDGRVGVRGGVR